MEQLDQKLIQNQKELLKLAPQLPPQQQQEVVLLIQQQQAQIRERLQLESQLMNGIGNAPPPPAWLRWACGCGGSQ